jgi:hypothetical protein
MHDEEREILPRRPLPVARHAHLARGVGSRAAGEGGARRRRLLP